MKTHFQLLLVALIALAVPAVFFCLPAQGLQPARAATAPWIEVSPDALLATQLIGQVTTQTLTLSNAGTQPLAYQVNEGGMPPDTVLTMHLDEPAGSTYFQDASGRNNDGSCSSPSCPISGVYGHAGYAVIFDGGDDFIQMPTNGFPTGNSDRTIAVWVRVNYVVSYYGFIAGYGQFGQGNQAYEIFISQGDDRVLCFSQWGAEFCGPALNLNEWYHVAVTNTGNQVTLYLDGVPVATGSLTIDTPGGTQFYLGRIPAEYEDNSRLNGLVDEVAVFNRALTANEIMALYQDGLDEDISWLSIEPSSGTIPAGASQEVTALFNTADLQPGVHTTTLNVLSNDPYLPVIGVPVTLTVEPSPSMGWVEGYVTDLRTGQPLEATIIAQGQPYTVTSDAETGYYKLWLEQGTYTLQASSPGYVMQTGEIVITAQQGVTQDFSLLLDAPWLRISPENLDAHVFSGGTVTQTVVLTNAGTTDLEFDFSGFPFDTLRIVSDGSWRVSSTLIPGWETVGFDDSAWEYTVAPAPVNCGWDHCWDDPDVYTMWSQTQYQTIYIRKSFDLPDVSSVISASITTRCDDDHDLYINGQLVASDWNGYAGPILETDIKPFLRTGKNVIAVKASDTAGGCRHMCVDAIIHFYPQLPGWITIEPVTGTIPVNTSTYVQVTFDAMGLPPGIYTTSMTLRSNDPLNLHVDVPVTMTVESNTNMGWVEGYVTDLRTGQPLEATIIAQGKSRAVISNAETGYYIFWLEPGTCMLKVSSKGHPTLVTEVEIIARQGVSRNYALLFGGKELFLPWIVK